MLAAEPAHRLVCRPLTPDFSHLEVRLFLSLSVLCCPQPMGPKVVVTHLSQTLTTKLSVQWSGITAFTSDLDGQIYLFSLVSLSVSRSELGLFKLCRPTFSFISLEGKEVTMGTVLKSWRQQWKHSVTSPWKPCRMKTGSFTVVLHRKWLEKQLLALFFKWQLTIEACLCMALVTFQDRCLLNKF